MDKWDKLNKELDDALDSMTAEDWNKIKTKNNMHTVTTTFGDNIKIIYEIVK